MVQTKLWNYVETHYASFYKVSVKDDLRFSRMLQTAERTESESLVTTWRHHGADGEAA